MGDYSIWHWLIIFIIYLVVIFIPIAKILRKSGYSRTWGILAFIPIVNLIALWVFAFAKWPALRKNDV